MGGLVNIYYNMSACSVRISDENPFLSVTKTEDFINFLLKFYKLYAWGISPGILLLPQNGWECRRMSTPKTGIFDGSRGSQQQNIFVNQHKANSKSLFLCSGVILGCWKVPKRVQKLYTILSRSLTKPYFTRVPMIAQPLKMRHVTRHVSVTLASRFSLHVRSTCFFCFWYSFILLVFSWWYLIPIGELVTISL